MLIGKGLLFSLFYAPLRRSTLRLAYIWLNLANRESRSSPRPDLFGMCICQKQLFAKEGDFE